MRKIFKSKTKECFWKSFFSYHARHYIKLITEKEKPSRWSGFFLFEDDVAHVYRTTPIIFRQGNISQ